MKGVWPSGSDVTDVNASCRTLDKQVVATGDDFGMVKLFDFPNASEHAKFKKYAGHSSHVTCVRFACDDQYLVSTGGMDTAVMVWRYGGCTFAGVDQKVDVVGFFQRHAPSHPFFVCCRRSAGARQRQRQGPWQPRDCCR